jgi:hypothetical protein
MVDLARRNGQQRDGILSAELARYYAARLETV